MPRKKAKTTMTPAAAVRQAELERVNAETRKLDAEAAMAEASARKAVAEAKDAEIKSYETQLELAKRQSSDERNFLYRFSKDVSHNSVTSCISTLTQWHRESPKCAMEIVFSSPGGSIVDGMELFDFMQHLRNEGHEITTGTLGYAASMAGILLQAGDVRWMGHQAWVMIHRAAFGAIGKTFEIEDEVRYVKRIEDRILDIFASRSHLTKLKIKRNWDRKDWWINADEAVELGLVDEVRAIMPEHMLKPKMSKKTKGNRKK